MAVYHMPGLTPYYYQDHVPYINLSFFKQYLYLKDVSLKAHMPDMLYYHLQARKLSRLT